jgi:hypothetical protein
VAGAGKVPKSTSQRAVLAVVPANVTDGERWPLVRSEAGSWASIDNGNRRDFPCPPGRSKCWIKVKNPASPAMLRVYEGPWRHCRVFQAVIALGEGGSPYSRPEMLKAHRASA